MYSKEIADKYKYSPLHGLFEIKFSPIHGQGLFVIQNKVILSGDVLVDDGKFCITHINKDKWHPNSFIRTPVGGFLNHSDEPNCKIVAVEGPPHYKYYKLVALKPLIGGDEVTVSYIDSKICV